MCQQLVGGGKSIVGWVAEGEDGNVGTLAELTPLPYRDFFERALPFSVDAGATGVADDYGAVAGQLCSVHHAAELVVVAGGADGDAGYGAEVGEVEYAVMGGTVIAHEASAVEAEDDGEGLKGDVVDDLVEGALGEG